MRRGTAAVAAVLMAAAPFAAGTLAAGAAAAAVAPQARDTAAADAAAAPTPADYAQAANWICRPGVDDGTCSARLDAVAIDAAGRRAPAPFRAAAAPAIDCFYVYPTASDDPGPFSDLAPDASERQVVHAQAARLGAACRLFVPVYHQVTMAGLHARMAGGGAGAEGAVGAINTVPYRDIRDAWRHYLAHDNGGRGVVLVGHSQGAILLKRLLAEEIDGRPAQQRLVGAYLAGNPDLTDASFATLRPCARRGQTGCIVAWSSYAAEDVAARRVFGGGRGGAPLCVDPAAIGGGRGRLRSYVSPAALETADRAPFVEGVGALSAECVRDAAGAVLRVRVEPGAEAARWRHLLAAAELRVSPGWGLHPLDISLVEGNLVDDIAAQARTWVERR